MLKERPKQELPPSLFVSWLYTSYIYIRISSVVVWRSPMFKSIKPELSDWQLGCKAACPTQQGFGCATWCILRLARRSQRNPLAPSETYKHLKEPPDLSGIHQTTRWFGIFTVFGAALWLRRVHLRLHVPHRYVKGAIHHWCIEKQLMLLHVWLEIQVGFPICHQDKGPKWKQQH